MVRLIILSIFWFHCLQVAVWHLIREGMRVAPNNMKVRQMAKELRVTRDEFKNLAESILG